MSSSSGLDMRVLHRYLGFFLAGIMAIYAISGVVMVFRNTDFLKKERSYTKVVDTNLNAEALGQAIRIKGLKPTSEDGYKINFKEGTYDKTTGEVTYTKKELPFILDSMTKMHKATTNSPLYFLNIFFGCSLLFFVVSSFWMFRPQSSIFKKGLYFTLAGIVLTLIMLFV
jgi:hypothetical protein